MLQVPCYMISAIIFWWSGFRTPSWMAGYF